MNLDQLIFSEMKLQKALYVIILSIQLICMVKQRFATMMHVFASINFNDTIEKIKHIKSENKKKRLKKDQKRPTYFSRERSPTDYETNDTNFTIYDVYQPNTNQQELPHVRINTVPTARFSPRTLSSRT